MRRLQHTPVALAAAATLYCLAQPAQAQSADGVSPPPAASAQQLDQVVVTGIRASRERSLLEKRAADSVMDVVSAEDIGKLPDKNVADAVQRVPGVNISSGSGGEGGFSENDRVSIRGTNPSLTQTTINGHAVATGDWYIGDQTQTVGRSVSFTLLPAEIVGSVEVQKSSQADYIEGGTAGNVNIVTRKPLDFKKTWTAEATIQGLRNDLAAKTAPQFNALLNWKNTDSSLGVLAQVFSESRYERRDGQELFLLGEGTIGNPNDNSGAVVATNPDLNNVVYPSQIGSALFTQHSKREGGLLDLEYKPSAQLTLESNAFYSHFNGTNFDTNFMASPTNMLGQGIAPTTYQVVNGTLVSASFAAQPYNFNDPAPGADMAFGGLRDSIYRPNAASMSSYLDFSADYRPSDAWQITSKLGTTRGVGQTPHDYGYEAYLVNTGLNYQLNGTNGPAVVSFPGYNPANFNDPLHVTNGGSWSDSVKVTDQETYGQIDVQRSFDDGVLESVKFGARFAQHKRTALGENFACSADPNNACFSNPGLALPMPAWNGTVSPSNFGRGIHAPAGFLSNFWVLDPANIVAWEQANNNVDQGTNYQGNFTVRERDAAVYAMANLAGKGWRGNVGLRVVDTHQYSLGYNLDANNNFVPSVVTHNYVNLLPSTNFKFDLSKDLVARVAASETMSRPDYSALSPAVSLNNIDLTGSGGNPNLKAIRSYNYNSTLEWYFAPQSLLSVDLFYMNMPSYVTFGYNTQRYLNTSIDQVSGFIITSPFNVSANNKGLELAWQQPLWHDFGALLNYTYANGRTSQGQPLVGSSSNTYNTEFYYEHAGFSARIAYTYRSSFLVGLANVTPQYAASLGTVAASINYKINDNLTVTFDGLNLNNPIIKYYSNAQQPQAFYSNGRQYYLGLRLSI
jgi:iron complex outermembrane receptor protein